MMTMRPTVSRQTWVEARKALLVKEKENTRQRDELARQRRELPWIKVDEHYVFDGPQGKVALADLFGTRSQLLVYHFMFGPDWAEGCPSCSFVSDHLDAATVHLAARDVSLAMVSRAPLPKIQAFKERMGWRLPWVSSHGNSFNHDFHVHFTPEERAGGAVYHNYTMEAFPSEEAPGASVFYRDPMAGEVYHTYSTFGRGLDAMVGTYVLLDLVPKGRDEDQLPFSMQWVRHHDRYASGGLSDPDKPYWPKTAAAEGSPACCGSKVGQ
ncbi:MAG: hypothetical protein JWO31_2874 [Phycisphaerales bacterium]|nr:hypothetical protein [Phycisphaerales bacterium]